VCFQGLKRLFVSRFRSMHSLDPKRVVRQTVEEPQSRRGDESCRRNHNSGRLADDPLLAIPRRLGMAPPGSDVIRTSYPEFLQKGSFFQPSGFPRAIGDRSHRRWLEGRNLIDNYAGDRLSGRADICGWNSGFAQKPDIPRRRDDVSNRLVAGLGARLRVSRLENSQRSWRRTSSDV
jgi:hypothetical protein